MICPKCEGRGGGFVASYDLRDGEYIAEWDECVQCEGTGEIEDVSDSECCTQAVTRTE